jgi:hypothetical protein
MERRKQLVIAGVVALTLIVAVVLMLQSSRAKNPSADIGRAPVITVPTSSADASAAPEPVTSSASATPTGDTGDASADDPGDASADDPGAALDPETQGTVDPKKLGKSFTLTGGNGKVVAIPDKGTGAE